MPIPDRAFAIFTPVMTGMSDPLLCISITRSASGRLITSATPKVTRTVIKTRQSLLVKSKMLCAYLSVGISPGTSFTPSTFGAIWFEKKKYVKTDKSSKSTTKNSAGVS